jgi:RNA polymerase sigma-70 factor (ECF subfamily)
LDAPHKTDEELMQRFIEGDMGAFEALYGRYRSPIYLFILRQCPDKGAAEELTQEVFMRVVRAAGAFRLEAKFSTWIYRIARNQLIDVFRKARHRRHASLDQPGKDDGPALAEKIPNTDAEPDRQTIANRLRHDLEKAIAALPDNQREVFLLREYSGLKFDEIGDIVDAKVGTVKSRMRYALEGLQKSLAGYEDYARTLT